MKKRKALLAVLAALALTASSGNAQSPPPRIGPGTEQWVIAIDIPPFSIASAAAWEGDGAKADHFFGVHPDNGGATARYSDRGRHMLVAASVQRDVRTQYLDFLIEAPYREDISGRFYEPDTSLITLFGQQVLFYCDKPPNCTDRIYSWRSGENLVVSVHSYALTNDQEGGQIRIPCPEPTKILQAYLDRYPSWLTQNWAEPAWAWANSPERTREHVHTEVAIELAATQYWLAMAGRQPAGEPDAHAVREIRLHLFEFAKKRERLLGGPPARAEDERLEAIRHLPLAERLPKLTEVAEEYKKWWTDNIGTPIQVPDLPPQPTPVPGTPPATAPSPAPPVTPSQKFPPSQERKY